MMPNKLWVSIPLIPGVQTKQEIELMAEFINKLVDNLQLD